MKRVVAFALLVIMTVVVGEAKRVRTGPTRLSRQRIEVEEALKADTVFAPDSEWVRLSGYDKTLRSVSESFFVTNALPDSVAIIEIDVVFEYSDMAGRQLHSEERCVKCHIPRGETRRLDVASWDKQQSFYFHLSAAPKRAQATPYRVKSIVKSVLTVEQ